LLGPAAVGAGVVAGWSWRWESLRCLGLVTVAEPLVVSLAVVRRLGRWPLVVGGRRASDGDHDASGGDCGASFR
jgi:hypothetical protein